MTGYYYTVEDRSYDRLIGEYLSYRQALKEYNKVSREEFYVSIGLYRNSQTDENDRDLLRVTN